MKLLLLGEGAALHALAWKLLSAPHVQEVYCAPGNAGTALLVGPPPVPLLHEAEVVAWAFQQQVNLVVVQGLPRWTDLLVGVGLPVLGAGEPQSEALSSRQAVRERLQQHGVPCVAGARFRSHEAAGRYLAGRPLPLWLRPDENDRWDALLLDDRYSGFKELERRLAPGTEAHLCLEEVGEGVEVTLGLLTDGRRAIPFGVSRPYDFREEGDRGPRTEGMGAYAPYGDRDLEERLMEQIGRPVVQALAAEGRLRPAFLSLRVVLGPAGPLLRDLHWGLEDLHAAVALPLWGGDLAGVLEWAAQGHLEEGFASWWPGVAVGVTVAVEGYPGPVPTGLSLPGLYQAELLLFHHATRLEANRATGTTVFSRPAPPPSLEDLVVTTGGRVLVVVGYAPSGPEARQRAYAGLERLRFPRAVWRRDIAAELEK